MIEGGKTNALKRKRRGRGTSRVVQSDPAQSKIVPQSFPPKRLWRAKEIINFLMAGARLDLGQRREVMTSISQAYQQVFQPVVEITLVQECRLSPQRPSLRSTGEIS